MAANAFGRDVNMNTISIREYNSLLETGREYQALRQALLAGGVTNDALDLLIASNLPPTPDLTPDASPIEEADTFGGSRWAQTATARPFAPNASFKDCHGSAGPDNIQDLYGCTLPEDASPNGENLAEELIQITEDDEQSSNEILPVKRSLVIKDLCPVTTLHSVAKVLRGGTLWEMFLSKRNSAAHVSFVDPVAAEKFFDYAQKNDIYIQGNKVTVAWDNQQRWIRPHIANRIAFSGLTRNLVIRFAREEWTAQSIRDDLEHIHQLEIVDLFFRNGHAFISLNSIQHALTAKTCMSSRLKYKRWKIDNWPDDCAHPIPLASTKQPHVTRTTRGPTIRRNRYDLPSEGTEDSKQSEQLY